jgi:BMFP domain-containing protein YqiC
VAINVYQGFVMINPAKLEEIAKQISSNMPQGLKNIADSFESKTKQVLQNKLSEMDFVSREEFEIQSKVLIRTREKLLELEAKVAELEAKMSSDKE